VVRGRGGSGRRRRRVRAAVPDPRRGGEQGRSEQPELEQRAAVRKEKPALVSTGWGRSELAANFYDEILFNGATFADLKPDGPRIFVGTTDLSEGTRVVFNRENFDILCADLGKIRLARAAAASSAVPVVLSSITIDNYGGTCGYRYPAWTKLFWDNPNPPRPAARTLKHLTELEAYGDRTQRPYLHLVDGRVSDHIGMRGALAIFATFEALHAAGVPTPFENVRNVVVFIVNSLAEPPNDWDKQENPPGTFNVLIKATGTPIDRYSYDTVETLKDMQARWQLLREVRNAIGPIAAKDPKLAFIERAPEINMYVIDVSFAALKDAAERDYLNQLPTSFVLPDEAVDRLRAAARTAILESPVIQQPMKQGFARMKAPAP
jgi:NTE family protein